MVTELKIGDSGPDSVTLVCRLMMKPPGGVEALTCRQRRAECARAAGRARRVGARVAGDGDVDHRLGVRAARERNACADQRDDADQRQSDTRTAALAHELRTHGACAAAAVCRHTHGDPTLPATTLECLPARATLTPPHGNQLFLPPLWRAEHMQDE
jgi:hypothetical protein